MREALLRVNTEIKQEADVILGKGGLLEALNAFGTPRVSGSYALDLMTWRDLDIYLVTERLDEANFFQLGGTIATLLQPVKMSFRNEVLAKTPGLPNGLYWGVYLGNEKAGAWKIDIWAVGAKEYIRLVEYETALKERLIPEARQTIMDLKSACWTHPGYRKTFTSTDVYDAVLQHGIGNMQTFRDYLKTKGIFI